MMISSLVIQQTPAVFSAAAATEAEEPETAASGGRGGLRVVVVHVEAFLLVFNYGWCGGCVWEGLFFLRFGHVNGFCVSWEREKQMVWQIGNMGSSFYMKREREREKDHRNGDWKGHGFVKIFQD